MAGKGKYDAGKRYLISGAELNRLAEEIATNKPLPGDGLKFRRIPGTGTEFWIEESSGGCRFGVSYDADTEEATVAPGRVYGGGGGVGNFPDPETLAIPSLPRYIYAKVTIEVIATVAYWDAGPEYIGNAAVTDIEIVQDADDDLNWEAPDPVVGDTGFAHLLLAEIDAEGNVEQVTCGDVTMIYCPPFSLSFHPRP